MSGTAGAGDVFAMEASYEPRTLHEAIKYFSDREHCLNYMVARRPGWRDGVVCPRCGSTKVSFLRNQTRWQCSKPHPTRQFSMKVGTFMEDSPVGLDKWLPMVWMVLNSKNRIGSSEISRALGVTRGTACFMLLRIQLAYQDANLDRDMELGDTFKGHRERSSRNMGHERLCAGGNVATSIAEGMPKRSDHVSATVNGDSERPLQNQGCEHFSADSAIFGEALKSPDASPVDC